MSKFFPEIHILFHSALYMFTGTPRRAASVVEGRRGHQLPTSRSPWVLGFIPTVHLGIAPSLVAFEPCAFKYIRLDGRYVSSVSELGLETLCI